MLGQGTWCELATNCPVGALSDGRCIAQIGGRLTWEPKAGTLKSRPLSNFDDVFLVADLPGSKNGQPLNCNRLYFDMHRDANREKYICTYVHINMAAKTTKQNAYEWWWPTMFSMAHAHVR